MKLAAHALRIKPCRDIRVPADTRLTRQALVISLMILG